MMDGFLDNTLAVWQPYYKQMLDKDDAEEIIANWGAFIDVLAEWRANKERKDS